MLTVATTTGRNSRQVSVLSKESRSACRRPPEDDAPDPSSSDSRASMVGPLGGNKWLFDPSGRQQLLLVVVVLLPLLPRELADRRPAAESANNIKPKVKFNHFQCCCC